MIAYSTTTSTFGRLALCTKTCDMSYMYRIEDIYYSEPCTLVRLDVKVDPGYEFPPSDTTDCLR